MSYLKGLNRTIIGLKDANVSTAGATRTSLNRTIIGLKDGTQQAQRDEDVWFESNYYRIESDILSRS